MAFNLKTFQTRTLTAIVFAAVMLTGLLWNHWSFFILFSIIHFGCWWEYFNLLEKIHHTSIHRYIRLGFMLTGFAIMVWFSGPALAINNYHLNENFPFPLSVSGIVFLAMGIFQTRQIHLKVLAAAASGLLYISLCWGFMLALRAWGDFENEFWNKAIPLGLVFSIWVNDTMAYMVGSFFGKKQLSKISPKKTWEGTIGGIILAVVMIVFVFYFLWDVFSMKDWVAISLIAAIAGTFGDLFESKLKRMAGVKDSGGLLPGHGGFLDRFDSLLFATSFVWVYLKIILW
ncbi:MAG TPA: phosphatidate cytidylyltransferase [Chitinophagaceae bacterium]|nr:phosphatidate cytidylyltransferase [Chitinophagaceae bacterium]